MSALTPISNPYILLVQGDEAFTQRASSDLQELGYTAIAVTDVTMARVTLEQQQPALMLIDRTSRRDDSFPFCRQLREEGNRMLIIMVVAQETVEERVACLEAGADDYLVKPYRTEALSQLLRFYLQPPQSSTEELQFEDLTLDLSSRRLFLADQTIDLTMKEFELLRYLMAHPRQVLTREQILENVWGYDFQGESNVIEVYIRYLRLKIEQVGHKRLIHTVRGVGYVLREA